MKAEAPVGAAVVGAAEGAVAAADLLPSALGLDGGQVVARVVEYLTAQDALGIQNLIGVEADKNIPLGFERLQPIHVIGQQQAAAIRCGAHVPRSPGVPALVENG